MTRFAVKAEMLSGSCSNLVVKSQCLESSGPVCSETLGDVVLSPEGCQRHTYDPFIKQKSCFDIKKVVQRVMPFPLSICTVNIL